MAMGFPSGTPDPMFPKGHYSGSRAKQQQGRYEPYEASTTTRLFARILAIPVRFPLFLFFCLKTKRIKSGFAEDYVDKGITDPKRIGLKWREANPGPY